ncbi:hypothetical protein [Pseudaminobacter sp. NGMCC 1.201702]|uniref:hypothetical protein n=1 Tax=Pseudaminobacter sp. NGMCC 1.201702 TaxID=3391825 RepID=UPI0039EE1F39
MSLTRINHRDCRNDETMTARSNLADDRAHGTEELERAAGSLADPAYREYFPITCPLPDD